MTTSSPVSPSVAAVVWPWRTPPQPRHRPSFLRVLLQVCIPYAVAAILYFVAPWTHSKTIAGVVACVGTLLLLLGLFAPKAFVCVERFVFRFVAWVGVALSWLLLTPLFFTFFLGSSIIWKLRRKDPLYRRLEPTAASYWNLRKPITDPVKHYGRQF